MCGVRFSLPVFLAVMLGCSWSQVLAYHAWAPGENGLQNVNRLDSHQDPATKAVQEWAPEDNGSQKENRLDSGLDRTMKVTLHNPNAPPTKLFAKCIVGHSAFVRFRQLRFPSKNVVFTRYVPEENQLKIYNTSWQLVNDRSLNTSLACASYAEKDASVMMYKLNGSRCSVSTVRMPMMKEICGSKKAVAVFVRTSCPEPTPPRVTLTPAPGAMNISWIINDPCNLTSKFKIDWVNVAGTNVDKVDKNVLQYRINNRPGCENQTVTVTALDSFSQPYGNPTSVSRDTLTRGPPTMATLNMAKYVDHIDVTWSIADDECLRINEFVLTWQNTSTLFKGAVNRNNNTYTYTINGLHGCLTITTTVKAKYDAGAGTTNILTNSTETLPEAPQIKSLILGAITHNSITVSWELQNYCQFIQNLTISARGGTYDLRKDYVEYLLKDLPCNTPVTITLIALNGDNQELIPNRSVSATTTIPDPVVSALIPSPAYRDATFTWTFADLCNKATKVKIEINSDAPVFRDDSVLTFTTSQLPCATPVEIKVTPVVDATSATPVGAQATASTTTQTKDPTLGGPPTLSSPADAALTVTWVVNDNECDYITGYDIRYGVSQSQKVTDKTAKTATISNYNACDLEDVIVDMMKGSTKITTNKYARSKPLLDYKSTTLGFRKATLEWTADDDCTLIHHYKLTSGKTVVETADETHVSGDGGTVDRSKSATVTDVDQCNTLSVTIDAVDSSSTSVMTSPLTPPAPTTTGSCNSAATAEDICYACLHYLREPPKSNQAASKTKCETSYDKLYRPKEAAEVAQLIAFLAAKLVPAADYADFTMFVDLKYNNSAWTWGGPAAVNEPASSSNWDAFPDPSVGSCAILSAAAGFKLENVGCHKLHFALCIKYITSSGLTLP